MELDLRIVGGTVIDGTGAPGVRADVGVMGGRVVALGPSVGPARETLDATGCVVAPGFVDIHTHYDAQVHWDARLGCSPWHGVTTAVLGNCGFGVAPTRPADREVVLRTLEKVEGMAYETLTAGLGGSWPFETFPEYLDAVEARGVGINVAAFVGHTPLRLHVLGAEASDRAARPDEVEAMGTLVREAMAAGALGFSTSRAATHHGHGGKPVPSRLATFEEIDALVGAMRSTGRGMLQAACGKGLFHEEFEALAARHDVAITWTALLAGMAGPGSHRRYLATAERQRASGARIVPQVACRPILFDFHLGEPYPFEILGSFRALMQASHEEKLRIYADPGFRARFKAESADGEKHANAGWVRRTVIARCDATPALEERPLVEVAAERGVDPVDLLLDLSVASGLRDRFRLAFINHDEEEVRELITHPDTVITLSDAGAHADQLCDAGYATHLLGHWVRDRGVMSLERAVHALTLRPAELVGITDRGLLAVGRPADVVVFDPATVGAAKLRRVRDQPGGAERLVSDALGVHAVVVNGHVVRRDGVDVGAPDAGALLRGGRAGSRRRRAS